MQPHYSSYDEMGLGKERQQKSPAAEWKAPGQDRGCGNGLEGRQGQCFPVSLLGYFFGKGASGIFTGIQFMKTAYERERRI